MKKQFDSPVAEIVEFDRTEDIITTSKEGENGGTDED